MQTDSITALYIDNYSPYVSVTEMSKKLDLTLAERRNESKLTLMFVQDC